MKAIRQQRLKHQAECLRPSAGARFGDYFKAVVVDPCGAARDFAGVNVPGDADHVQQSGPVEFVAVIDHEFALALMIGVLYPFGARARVNVGDIESGFGGGGLGKGRARQGDEDCV